MGNVITGRSAMCITERADGVLAFSYPEKESQSWLSR